MNSNFVNTKTIGKCSICGGNVTVPQMWWGIIAPTPTCEECGAIKDNDLPVVKMKKAPKTWTSDKIIISDNTNE